MKINNKTLIITFSLLVLGILMAAYLVSENSNRSEIQTKAAKNDDNEDIYELELDRWDIYNDGTHPEKTTGGLNNALRWASDNGFSIFKIPKGEYLISKGKKPSDSEARINMVSNMKFELDNKAVIRKEKNGFEAYELLYMAPGTRDVILKGGTYEGDRPSHDYTDKDNEYSKNTHEFGMGIYGLGVENITIKGVKTKDFTGDGIMIGGSSTQINILTAEDFESGSINSEGTFVDDASKTRTTNKFKTNFDNEKFDEFNTFQFSRPQGLSKETNYEVFFYDSNDRFISKSKDNEMDWSLIEIPEDASYFHAVFDQPYSEGFRVEYWNKVISENISISNSESFLNRRQGITVAGVNEMKIENNDIHDIKGIAPQSGIDLEAGFYPNTNITINNNKIYNNERYNVILFDGEDVIVEGNYLGENENRSSIGVAVSKPFRSGALIKENHFDGSKIVADGEAKFVDNIMNDSIATLFGPKTEVDGMQFKNSQLSIKSTEPNGVAVSNIEMESNMEQTNTLSIDDHPVHLKNITLKGKAAQRSIVGNVEEGSVFDNLKVIGFNSTYGIDLPRGTYNNCSFESSQEGNGTVVINDSGDYILNQCSLKGLNQLLVIENKDAYVEVHDSHFDLKDGKSSISVNEAKVVSILNNTIKMKGSASVEETIKVQEAFNSPSKIKIEGNMVESKPSN
ncbi:right-handed parallel beta-helix repeat-containing protein [Halobacillus halophilus]|uniref:right-handed parallel beta-helix repeat-containing protein n=1 Tax=Halobacillus halophilus TaxID=1570 RepID=UPI001CD35408|nr:right-handed parallel beta-helix repeat-containing protein [Halobacillus halophilus]MCA1010075.1 right-handed parallel beta-helix repeat-containing protein [Halobacillus halophilus]